MPKTKKEVLQKLALIKDDPEEEALLFDFDAYAQQIKDLIINENTPTPFTIAIHGEWGSGKTSLMLAAEKQVKEATKSKENWHTIRFDAWEYERVDIISALFQKIESEYKNAGKKASEFGKSVGMLLADVALRKGIGISLDETEKHFKNLIDEIPNIKNKIEDLTKDGRLIIFVDDLDRCHVDNVLEMLEAIKMFLTAKNVIFVVAVDMTKIERAWKLRYHSDDGSKEGLEHVEKIFPLKLSLPPKKLDALKDYVEKMCKSLSEPERQLIVKGCPPNPRKIKRIANLAYFVLNSLKDDEEFDDKVPLVLIWCILTSVYPKFVEIVKRDLTSLFELVIIISHSKDFQELLRVLTKIDQISAGRIINLSKLQIPGSFLSPITIRALSYILENEPSIENILREVGFFYSIMVKEGEDWQKYVTRIVPYYREKLKPLQDVIYHSSLIGH